MHLNDLTTDEQNPKKGPFSVLQTKSRINVFVASRGFFLEHFVLVIFDEMVVQIAA